MIIMQYLTSFTQKYVLLKAHQNTKPIFAYILLKQNFWLKVQGLSQDCMQAHQQAWD